MLVAQELDYDKILNKNDKNEHNVLFTNCPHIYILIPLLMLFLIKRRI